MAVLEFDGLEVDGTDFASSIVPPGSSQSLGLGGAGISLFFNTNCLCYLNINARLQCLRTSFQYGMIIVFYIKEINGPVIRNNCVFT